MTARTSHSVPFAARPLTRWFAVALCTVALVETASAEQMHKQLVPRPWSVTPITCGQVITASIDFPGETDAFRFHGTAGDVVELTLAGDVCCVFYYASVFAPSGAALGYLGSDSLREFTLSETGQYSVYVNTYNYVFTGTYHIGLSCRDPLGTIVDDLVCGEVVASSISRPAEVDYFTFDGEAGDVVELTLAGDVCCVFYYASLFAPDGAALGYFGSDSLREYTLPVTGQYSVRVNTYNYVFTGTYSLGFSCRAPVGPIVEHLSCGEVVTSAISRPAEVDYFTFDGQANDVVELTLAGDVCCVYYYASVFDPSGVLLGYFGSDFLREFTLPVTGQYSVRVNTYNYVFTGTYSLGFSCRAPVGAAVVDHLTCGEVVPSAISRPAEVDYFTFDGQANEVVELTLLGNVCCVYYYASVFDPGGASLGYIGSDGQAAFTLPVTGQYSVRVNTYNYVFIGTYSLELGCP